MKIWVVLRQVDERTLFHDEFDSVFKDEKTADEYMDKITDYEMTKQEVEIIE